MIKAILLIILLFFFVCLMHEVVSWMEDIERRFEILENYCKELMKIIGDILQREQERMEGQDESKGAD